MTDPEIIRQRMQEFMPVDGLDEPKRIARALEYIAFHLVEQNKKLDQLIGAFALTQQGGPPGLKQSLRELNQLVAQIVKSLPQKGPLG